ncbi:Holliday junction resolvase RuvX [Salmonella enterica subsp. enterica]|nr:Holliday junction resolvase RuvX [Salmonella enterica subsp. enterica]
MLIERLLKRVAAGRNYCRATAFNMDGTEQPLTARARKFANRIHGRFGVTVTLRLTTSSTVEAQQNHCLNEVGIARAEQGKSVNSASAVIILESYFEQGY